jgi:hypothetical protein
VLVTAPDVILPGELPDTWGHMVLKGGRLHVEKQAPALTPDALEPSFVASLLRRAGQTSQAMIDQQISAATAAARERVNAQIVAEVERRTSLNAEAVKVIEQFKEQTGVDLMSWESHAAGKDFGAYLAARQAADSLRYSTSVKALRAAADAIEAAERALQQSDLLRTEATA